MKAKFTKRYVRDLPTDGSMSLVWDTALRGFGLRFQGSTWRYVLKYRVAGRQRWLALGRHGDLTVEKARDKAERFRGLVADDKDPAEVRDQERQMPTLKQFSVRYLADHADVHKKPASTAADRANLNRAILPKLGKHRLDKITRADITRFHLARKETPTNANRCLALLSHMLNMAEKWGIRADNTNPCRHVERFKEVRRKRYLSEAELARLGQALGGVDRDKSESPYAVAAVRLLLFTGARMSEVLTLRWDAVDIEAGVLRLADSKTGEKVVFLNAPAKQLLSRLRRFKGNDYVIVGRMKGQHLQDLEKPWQRIRALAKLADVRLHDLRHSFASVAVSGGASLPLIGGLLGHSQVQTTSRYAHLSDNPLKAASERVGARIVSAMKKQARR